MSAKKPFYVVGRSMSGVCSYTIPTRFMKNNGESSCHLAYSSSTINSCTLLNQYIQDLIRNTKLSVNSVPTATNDVEFSLDSVSISDDTDICYLISKAHYIVYINSTLGKITNAKVSFHYKNVSTTSIPTSWILNTNLSFSEATSKV